MPQGDLNELDHVSPLSLDEHRGGKFTDIILGVGFVVLCE